MIVLRSFEDLPVSIQGSVVAPGNFDGVHLGHRALIKSLKEKAIGRGIPLIILLFEPQPSEYFHKKQAATRLTTLREKINLLRECEVDFVFCLKFNQKLAHTQPIDFARKYLFEGLKTQILGVGEDFRFGHQRTGDIDLLTHLSTQYSSEVLLLNDFLLDDTRVSSTRIRKALAKADFDEAAKLLGRNYTISGRVVKGAGRGRQWDIPTANIHLKRQSVPFNGVYCVKLRHRQSWINGVANIGNRPTVDGSKTVLEVHLLDFKEDLYGENVEVLFLSKLREEIKFEAIDKLIAQIQKDILQAKEFFN